eukprot:6578404-Pyramimonas_sp.AAC.1
MPWPQLARGLRLGSSSKLGQARRLLLIITRWRLQQLRLPASPPAVGPGRGLWDDAVRRQVLLRRRDGRGLRGRRRDHGRRRHGGSGRACHWGQHRDLQPLGRLDCRACRCVGCLVALGIPAGHLALRDHHELGQPSRVVTPPDLRQHLRQCRHCGPPAVPGAGIAKRREIIQRLCERVLDVCLGLRRGGRRA